MSGHTPGPWSVWTGRLLGQDIFHDKRTVCADSGVGDKLAVAYCDYHTPERAEANARLIAAAPDLLEMCQMMAAEYSREDGVFFERHPAIGRLLKTIAKATGTP